MSSKPIRVHQDAVAVEALQIIEHYRTKLLLVCQTFKHQPKKETVDIDGSSRIEVY